MKLLQEVLSDLTKSIFSGTKDEIFAGLQITTFAKIIKLEFVGVVSKER
jgi:hypothetical protein